MSKYKVATVVGTRPELIRLSRIISLLDDCFEHTLIHTGQNYDHELNQIFFDDLNIRQPDIFTESAASTPGETIGNIINDLSKIFDKSSYDAVLILGDTNSSLGAISAKRKKIPIFHMEAGNRSFDLRVPEEINRKIVDHIADINLPYTNISREHLLAEGIKPQSIIVTGSPMKEVLDHHRDKIDKSKVLKNLGLKKNNFFIVSSHREENVDNKKNLVNLVDLLNQLALDYNFPVLVSLHPRTKNRIERVKTSFNKNIIFHKPFAFSDYIKLQENAFCTLSDSGTITEESSILGFNAINLRESHERPEGFTEGAVMFSGLKYSNIRACLDLLAKDINKGNTVVEEYKASNVSTKIVKIIQSYISYVNHFTWHK